MYNFVPVKFSSSDVGWFLVLIYMCMNDGCFSLGSLSMFDMYKTINTSVLDGHVLYTRGTY